MFPEDGQTRKYRVSLTNLHFAKHRLQQIHLNNFTFAATPSFSSWALSLLLSALSESWTYFENKYHLIYRRLNNYYKEMFDLSPFSILCALPPVYSDFLYSFHFSSFPYPAVSSNLRLSMLRSPMCIIHYI